MHIVIYGPEGSGKGTQAKLISQKFTIPLYTSGDLVRDKAISSKDKISSICRNALATGGYVDDNIMYILWQEKLSTNEAKKSFILDGFPRNLNQAYFLIKEITKFGYKLDKVIYLKLNDEIAKDRLIKRKRKLFKGSLESHDSPERVQKRLEIYRQKEKELLNFFQKKRLLETVDGNKSVEKVFASIVKKLKNK